MLFIVEIVGVMLPRVVGSTFAAFVLLAEKLFQVRFVSFLMIVCYSVHVLLMIIKLHGINPLDVLSRSGQIHN